MTRTNTNSEQSLSRRSSPALSAIAQSSSNETKDIISQNELTIQKLLLELQDDLKRTKECYNTSRDAWLAIQQQKTPTSTNENANSQLPKSHLTQALSNVQNEMEMYRAALTKIAEVRQLQIEIANVSKNHNDVNRSHTTRRGLADLLSHIAYSLKIYYGNEHHGRGTHRVSFRPDDDLRMSKFACRTLSKDYHTTIKFYHRRTFFLFRTIVRGGNNACGQVNGQARH